MKKEKTIQFFSNNSQLLIPLIAILLLVVFNLFRDPSFFSVGIAANNNGDPVLQGNLISILNGASELVILSMGMTLVTAASGGQDISVGALAAIAGSVFVKVLKGGAVTPGTVLVAFLACCAVAMIFGAFNGSMVAFFRIQPMIATLILFTCGRSIAYWINGGATPTITSPIINAIGSFIPGVPVPTPILIVILMGAALIPVLGSLFSPAQPGRFSSAACTLGKYAFYAYFGQAVFYSVDDLVYAAEIGIFPKALILNLSVILLSVLLYAADRGIKKVLGRKQVLYS